MTVNRTLQGYRTGTAYRVFQPLLEGSSTMVVFQMSEHPLTKSPSMTKDGPVHPPVGHAPCSTARGPSLPVSQRWVLELPDLSRGFGSKRHRGKKNFLAFGAQCGKSGCFRRGPNGPNPSYMVTCPNNSEHDHDVRRDRPNMNLPCFGCVC